MRYTDHYSRTKTGQKQPFGGTYCALPMIWATKNSIQTDMLDVVGFDASVPKVISQFAVN